MLRWKFSRHAGCACEGAVLAKVTPCSPRTAPDFRRRTTGAALRSKSSTSEESVGLGIPTPTQACRKFGALDMWLGESIWAYGWRDGGGGPSRQLHCLTLGSLHHDHDVTVRLHLHLSQTVLLCGAKNQNPALVRWLVERAEDRYDEDLPPPGRSGAASPRSSCPRTEGSAVGAYIDNVRKRDHSQA